MFKGQGSYDSNDETIAEGRSQDSGKCIQNLGGQECDDRAKHHGQANNQTVIELEPTSILSLKGDH